MKTASKRDPLKGIGDVLTDLLGTQVRLGVQLMESLVDRPAGMLMDAMKRGVSATQGCCEIPDPCWVPQSLGELVSHTCPGAIATVRFLITNCDMVPRTITAKATNDAAGKVKIEPASLPLRPQQRGFITASLEVPADAHDCQEFETLIWLIGCKAYYLRWTIKAGKRGCDCCHEVEVADCPDLIHHWYDHFYCWRPCLHDLLRHKPE